MRTSLIAALCFMTTACGILFPKPSGGGGAGEEVVELAVGEDGANTAQLDASSDKTQKLVIEEGAGAGSEIAIPPGALGINAEIVIQNGEDLSAPETLAALEAVNTALIADKGEAVLMTTKPPTDLKAPMTIALEIPAQTGLTQSEHYGIVFKKYKLAEDNWFAGLVGSADVIIENGKARFETSHFGIFQVIRTTEPVTSTSEDKPAPAPTTKTQQEAKKPALLVAQDGNFSAVIVGQSTDLTLTLVNNGERASSAMQASFDVPEVNLKGGEWPGSGGDCGATLAAQSSCKLVVTLAPTTPGALSASVQLSYFNGKEDTSISIALLGEAFTPAELSVASEHDFGTLTVGLSADHTLTLTNSGGVDATALSAQTAAPFSIKDGSFPGTGGSCTPTLEVGASCTIVVSYAPTAKATDQQPLNLAFNNGASDQTVIQPLKGQGQSPATLAISPANHDFGLHANGSTTSVVLTITNSGDIAATSLADGGALASPFDFTSSAYPGNSGNCGATLAAGASCSIELMFQPTVTATSTDTVEVTYNNGVSAQTASAGLQGTSAPPAVLSISDVDPYDFGNIAIGVVVNKTFTISNSGGVPAESFVDGGTLAIPFNYDGGSFPGNGGTCTPTLNNGDNCTIVIQYAPGSGGPHSSVVSLNYNDGTSTQALAKSLAGTGQFPANLNINPINFDFGPNPVNAPAIAILSLDNTGDMTATSIMEFAMTPPFGFSGGMFPGLGGDCTTSLIGGGTCTVEIEFYPTSTGFFNSPIDFQYDDGNGPSNAIGTLDGEGTAAAITMQPRVLRVAQTESVELTGDFATIKNLTLAGTTLEIPKDASNSLDVTIKPAKAGPIMATIQYRDNKQETVRVAYALSAPPKLETNQLYVPESLHRKGSVWPDFFGQQDLVSRTSPWTKPIDGKDAVVSTTKDSHATLRLRRGVEIQLNLKTDGLISGRLLKVFGSKELYWDGTDILADGTKILTPAKNQPTLFSLGLSKAGLLTIRMGDETLSHQVSTPMVRILLDKAVLRSQIHWIAKGSTTH